MSSGSKRKRSERFIRWEYPREGWVRLNTDGASKGNPGFAGAGGLIRSHKGEVHEIFSLNCGTCTVTKAELLAVMRGLAIAWNGAESAINGRLRGCGSFIGGADSNQLSLYSHHPKV